MAEIDEMQREYDIDAPDPRRAQDLDAMTDARRLERLAQLRAEVAEVARLLAVHPRACMVEGDDGTHDWRYCGWCAEVARLRSELARALVQEDENRRQADAARALAECRLVTVRGLCRRNRELRETFAAVDAEAAEWRRRKSVNCRVAPI